MQNRLINDMVDFFFASKMHFFTAKYIIEKTIFTLHFVANGSNGIPFLIISFFAPHHFILFMHSLNRTGEKMNQFDAVKSCRSFNIA